MWCDSWSTDYRSTTVCWDQYVSFEWLSISTLPEKGEESLDPSTKKQLKSLVSRWRTAPHQHPTNRETVHFQCPVNLQDLYLSGQATKSQGSTEHSCWGTSGITRGQAKAWDWPGMWWEYTWLINRWVVNTCREHEYTCTACQSGSWPGLGLASTRTQPIH